VSRLAVPDRRHPALLRPLSAAETFWEFSLRTYGQPGVAEACLALQDEHGADVNLLLYCCWAGWRSAALDESAFGRAMRFSQQWARNVVQPLRGVRRWMKSGGCEGDLPDFGACMDLRQEVKAVELSAEKLQQAALESLPLDYPPGGRAARGPAAVAANLRCYCDAAGIAWSEEVRLKLGVILRAAFPPQALSEF